MKLLLLCVILTGSAWARLRAGASLIDITPFEWPVRLIGSFSLIQASQAHDPLHVRAIVLEDSGVKLAMAVIDSCYVKRDVLDEAKKLAESNTGIPTRNMLISATHTHSAPPSAAADRDSLEGRYVKRLIEQIAAAIGQANARLEPARIGWARRAVPEELFNRRWYMREGSIPPNPFGEPGDKVRMNPAAASPDLLHPAGPTDPDFYVVSIQSASGRPLALLGNYSLHYVGGVPGNQVSADYFGEFARQMASRLAPAGAGFLAALSNGTSGDVNNINFLHPRSRAEPFVRIREVAERLAGHAAEMARSLPYQDSAPLRAAVRELQLRYRKPTSEQIRFSRAALEEKDESKLPQRAKAYAERALRLHDGPDSAMLKIQALRIGDLAIAAIPAETFTEIGLSIKERSPFADTFTIELANGHYGYLPAPRHFDLGGYETWLGTNLLERNASLKITETILELFGELRR